MRVLMAAVLIICGVVFAQEDNPSPQKLPPRRVEEDKELKRLESFMKPENGEEVPREIIRDWGATTVDELLTWVADVPTQNAGILTEKVVVNMRGMPGRYGAQRVSVLLDGVPLNEEYMGDVDFRFVPFEAVGRIKVLRGVLSAEYGGVGTSGAVLLDTLSPTETPKGRLRIRLADHNTKIYSALHGGRYNRLRWLLSGSYAYTDGYLLNDDGTQRDWEMGRGLAKAECVITPNIILSAIIGTASGHGSASYFNQQTDRDFQVLKFGSQKDPKSAWDFSIIFWRTGLATDYLWRSSAFNSRYRQHTIGVKGCITLKTSIHSVKAGLCYTEAYSDVREIGGTVEGTIFSTHFFLEDMISYRRLRLRLGVRYDDDSVSGDAATPRICSSFLVLKWLTIRFAAGRTWRPPSISDLYLPDTNYGNLIFRGNPTLEPEVAWTYELGARIAHSLLKRRHHPLSLNADSALFYSDARKFYDYVVVGTQGGLPLLEPHNIPRISIYGAELSLRLSNILPRLHLFLNYAYVRSKYKEYPFDPDVEGNNLEYIPSHYGTAGLVYAPTQRTTLIIWCRASDHRNTDIHNWKGNNLPGYAIFGIRAALLLSDLKTLSIRMLVSIDNLTDRGYEEYRGVPAPGRTFGVSMEVIF